MPVTDTQPPSPYSAPPPPHTYIHTVFNKVPISSGGRVQCSIAEHYRAYFLCFFEVSVA